MSVQKEKRVVIIGAAGRDFHDFNVYWKNQPDVRVVCFTATQIPNIDGRVYPPELAGPKYPEGIPILSQDGLAEIIKQQHVDLCVLAYSDLSSQSVMDIQAKVQAAGANFQVLSPKATQIASTKPVIAICAVRTGCGKSQTARYVCQLLKKQGLRVAVVRHPMPYGNLVQQRCQRFACLEDLKKHKCTIEEREEYELHILEGNLLFAGVDYEMILRVAEREADVIIWDGGNNDASFYKTDLLMVVADPMRVGHETAYYPGNVNALMADMFIMGKANAASAANMRQLEENLKRIRPNAPIFTCDSLLTADFEGEDSRIAYEHASRLIKGRKVLAIDDGPTLTHGEMPYGAAYMFAKEMGAGEMVDARPFAHGSIAKAFEKFTHLARVLPALGYGERQVRELEQTIAYTPCEAVVIGTPISLHKLISIRQPTIWVRYSLAPRQPVAFARKILDAVGEAKQRKLTSKL